MMPHSLDPVCQALSQILENGLDIHRTLAATALGRIGYGEAVPVLIKALLDEDSDVRTDAAAALLKINDPVAAEPLMDNLLGDPCPEVKITAIEALSGWGYKPVIPVLRELLHGRSEDIVWDEEEFYQTGWDDWLDIQIKVIEALARLGDEDSVPDIVKAIDDEDAQDMTEMAFAALARLGDAGERALQKYASAKDERRRRRAITVLGKVDSKLASKIVGNALNDKAASVRMAAGYALAGRDSHDKRLEMLLLDKNPDIRAAFVPVCGQAFPNRLAAMLFDINPDVQSAVLDQFIRHPDVVDELGLTGRLLEMSEGRDGKVAGLALMALIAVDPEQMQDEVIRALHNSELSLEVRSGAVKALAMVGNQAALDALKSVLADDHRQLRLDAMTAIKNYAQSTGPVQDAAMEILLASLRGEVVPEPEPEPETESESEENETTVSEETGSTESEEIPVVDTIDAAEPMLASGQLKPVEGQDEDDPFPASTLAALMGAPSESVDAALAGDEAIELSEHDIEFLELTNRSKNKKTVSPEIVVAPYQDVRCFAARLLGGVTQDDVAIALAEAINQTDRELVLTAADSLTETGGKTGQYPDVVTDTLLGKLDDVDKDVRFYITRAYAQAPSPGAANMLKKSLQDPSSFVRTEAVRGLGRCGCGYQELEPCLKDDIPQVRLAAAEILALNADEAIIRRLVEFALEFEGYHVRQVAMMLRQNKTEFASGLFVQILKDEDRKRVWKVAIEALEILGQPLPDKLMAA